MRFTIDAKELADTVAYVAPAVMVGPPSPALAGIQVSAGPTGDSFGVTFAATDTIAYQGANVALSECEPGQIVVSGRMLTDICKALPAGEVEVSLSESVLVLRQKRSQYRVPVIGEPFPAAPAARAEVMHTLPADALLRLLATVRHCADDRSYQAPGVLLDLGLTTIEVTAMTNAVLSRAGMIASGDVVADAAAQVIVGIGALEAAVKGAVKGAGETVSLSAGEGSLMVVGAGRGAWIKQFTSSKAVSAGKWFEGTSVGEIRVMADELLAAIRRIPLALQAGERDLPGANLSVAGGILTMQGRDGMAIEQVDVEMVEREALLDGTLTTTLLADVLATCGKRQIVIEFHARHLLVRDHHEGQQAAHVVVLRRGI